MMKTKLASLIMFVALVGVLQSGCFDSPDRQVKDSRSKSAAGAGSEDDADATQDKNGEKTTEDNLNKSATTGSSSNSNTNPASSVKEGGGDSESSNQDAATRNSAPAPSDKSVDLETVLSSDDLKEIVEGNGDVPSGSSGEATNSNTSTSTGANTNNDSEASGSTEDASAGASSSGSGGTTSSGTGETATSSTGQTSADTGSSGFQIKDGDVKRIYSMVNGQKRYLGECLGCGGNFVDIAGGFTRYKFVQVVSTIPYVFYIQNTVTQRYLEACANCGQLPEVSYIVQEKNFDLGVRAGMVWTAKYDSATNSFQFRNLGSSALMSRCHKCLVNETSQTGDILGCHALDGLEDYKSFYLE